MAAPTVLTARVTQGSIQGPPATAPAAGAVRLAAIIHPTALAPADIHLTAVSLNELRNQVMTPADTWGPLVHGALVPIAFEGIRRGMTAIGGRFSSLATVVALAGAGIVLFPKRTCFILRSLGSATGQWIWDHKKATAALGVTLVTGVALYCFSQTELFANACKGLKKLAFDPAPSDNNILPPSAAPRANPAQTAIAGAQSTADTALNTAAGNITQITDNRALMTAEEALGVAEAAHTTAIQALAAAEAALAAADTALEGLADHSYHHHPVILYVTNVIPPFLQLFGISKKRE